MTTADNQTEQAIQAAGADKAPRIRPNDSVAMLSKLSGISADGIAALAAEVKVNQAKLNGCTGHDFEPVPGARVVFGAPDRYRCKHCGGTVDRHAFYWFELGRARGTSTDSS